MNTAYQFAHSTKSLASRLQSKKFDFFPEGVLFLCSRGDWPVKLRRDMVVKGTVHRKMEMDLTMKKFNIKTGKEVCTDFKTNVWKVLKISMFYFQ